MGGVIGMEEVIVGFPTRKPDQIDCRFGTTTVFGPCPIPPHLHVSGIVIHALNHLPRDVGLQAAQRLTDIADEVDLGRGVLRTVETLESAFGCTVADRGYLPVHDAPQFAIEVAGRLVRGESGPWLGMEVTQRGLPPVRKGRNEAFWYASIGGVYSGSLRHSCSNAMVRDRLEATFDQHRIDVPLPSANPELTYARAVAHLLAETIATVAYLYVKDERRFPDSRFTFQTVASATRNEYQTVLAQRPDDE